ncbi:MAG: hypothetical protein E7332_08890 [Clostridiales bacterium]|nr:hypothetical protein [Clostridiales bacterium]
MSQFNTNTVNKNITAASLIAAAEQEAASVFDRIRKISEFNTFKVIDAFRKCEVSERHFAPTTGYGYSDQGREMLARLFSEIFRTEDAIVSPHFASGTHTLSVGLFGLLRPGDRFLSVTGTPYDTIRGVIGIEGNADGSMKDFGIGYSEVALTSEGKMDIPAVMDALAVDDTIKVVYIQRSRGYELRPSITIAEMEKLISAVKEKYPQICVAVDNCYGEFTEEKEPTEVGADIIMGSLIKNPGAGIAPSGGYIAGKKNYVEKIAGRFTAPGLGMEIGSYHSSYLPFFQGIYMAPHIVSQALMGVVLTAKVMEKLGYRVFPAYDAKRTDITQAVVFDTEEELVAFIRAVQKASPVDSNVVPYPWEMPGYEDPVIMAAGTFMQGGSIELSADAPIRKPYTAYMQGGMVYENVK